MNATLTAVEIDQIATELKAIYGNKPSMEIIDLARNQKVLKAYGVSNIKDVFLIAQALNKVAA